jgi:hypothetical protein
MAKRVKLRSLTAEEANHINNPKILSAIISRTLTPANACWPLPPMENR